MIDKGVLTDNISYIYETLDNKKYLKFNISKCEEPHYENLVLGFYIPFKRPNISMIKEFLNKNRSDTYIKTERCWMVRRDEKYYFTVEEVGVYISIPLSYIDAESILKKVIDLCETK
jgi:hypothetical protein